MGKYINTVITILVSQWVFSQITMPPVGQTDYNVLSGQTVTLSDLQSITLSPNTFIQSGADFTAVVLPSTAYEPYTDIALSGTENYVFTRSFQRAMPAFTTSGTKEGDVYEAITYFDGLGRPLQQVDIKAARDRDDIITHMEYDGYGRQEKEWLPYHEPTGSLGSYRGDRASATQGYYKTNYAEDFTTLSTPNVNAHSQKEFENSPLNRVLKQAAPGQDWKLGNGHEIGFGYQVNSQSNDAVPKFEVVFTGGNPEAPTLQKLSGVYATGELYKNVTYDENHTSGTNHSTEEFVDKNGRVILKRTYHNGSHDTYYVYDDYGNLTYVIPPKVDASDGVDATELNELCYQYKYDYRNRLVEKKLPGKGWEYIVYNKLDQPVLTQDANLRAQNRWLFTKYDAFGRVAFTGRHNSTASRTAMQNAANDTATYTQYVERIASAQTIAGTSIHYTSTSIPLGVDEIHTINYYDDYAFDWFSNLPSGYEGQAIVNYNNANTEKTKGLATGTEVKVLDSSPVKWITTVTGYDEKGRAIYVKSANNYLETTDIVETELDFGGKVVQTRATHQRTGHSDIVTVDTFTYDHQGRLVRQQQTINGQAQETLVDNSYDHLGQLVQKEVGGGLQTVRYAYNVRGWLKRINDPTNLGGDLFAFGINYNTVGHSGTPLYNGNIAETEWRTANTDNGLKWYRYAYDPLNRITSATANSSNYSLSGITYDKNGNLQSLTRRGHTNAAATSFGNMDILDYDYHNSEMSNRLYKVNDTGSKTYGFKDSSANNQDYWYDANGNMVRDLNKGIGTTSLDGISYNHLNLPREIKFDNNNNKKINYIYDALGTKVQKVANDNGSLTTTDYAGNFVYENGTLQFFSHPEGYVNANGGGYDYVYQYKDHLGNIRLSYADDPSNPGTPTIIEENNYYPFGLKHKGYNYGGDTALGNDVAQRWKFGGKEYQEELNLNWYDVTARNYDPALGRWMNLDPLAEQMRRHSPYNFGFDNPIYFQDYDGMAPTGCCGTGPGNPLGHTATFTLGLINLGRKFLGMEPIRIEGSSSSSSQVSNSDGYSFVTDDGQPSGDPSTATKTTGDVQEVNVTGLEALTIVAGGKKGSKGDGMTTAKDPSKKNPASSFADGVDRASNAGNSVDAATNASAGNTMETGNKSEPDQSNLNIQHTATANFKKGTTSGNVDLSGKELSSGSAIPRSNRSEAEKDSARFARFSILENVRIRTDTIKP